MTGEEMKEIEIDVTSGCVKNVNEQQMMQVSQIDAYESD